MRDYEIVFIIHPDCNGKISKIVNHYVKIINDASGKIYRIEDWGCRQLAYSIKGVYKAYYVLLNIQIPTNLVKELNDSFHFNDVILRSLIIRSKYLITGGPSPMMKQKEILNGEHFISESKKQPIT